MTIEQIPVSAACANLNGLRLCGRKATLDADSAAMEWMLLSEGLTQSVRNPYIFFSYAFAISGLLSLAHAIY